MRFILVRHGETFFNKIGLVQGWVDSALTDQGIKQAYLTKKKLENIHIDRCFTSSSERAVDTVEIILENRDIEITREKRLKEINFGDFEGTSDKVFVTLNSMEPDKLEKGFKAFDGEDKTDLIKREVECIDEYEKLYPNETILIGGHGVSLKELILYLTGDEIYKFDPNFKWLGNADVVIIEGDHLNYHIVEYNKGNK